MADERPDWRQKAPPSVWKRIAALVGFFVFALAVSFLFMVVIPGR